MTASCQASSKKVLLSDDIIYYESNDDIQSDVDLATERNDLEHNITNSNNYHLNEMLNFLEQGTTDDLIKFSKLNNSSD